MPSKQPWQLTTDERLAKRFAPGAIAARAARQDELRKSFTSRRRREAVSDDSPVLVDAIDGSETPELFLVWELFDQLVSLGFPPDGAYRDQTRAIVLRRAAALGFGQDLWNRLEVAIAPLLILDGARALQSPRPPETRDGGRESLGSGDHRCRARHAAIEAAKREFGEEPFLRLLYEAVAPSVSRAYLVTPELADHVRSAEEGCQ